MELQLIGLHKDKLKELYNVPVCQQALSMYEDFYATVGFEPPWVGYFVIRQGQVVGSCGFVGPPKGGKIEIAYWTFEEFEGQGVASFACKALLAIAYQTNSGLTVTAKTAPEQNASTKILENNGFAFTMLAQDEEIGTAWLWTHQRAGAQS